MKKYKAVIFDLDGTLLDTLEDLTDSVNHVLKLHNCPERTIDEVRHFVGNGIRLLIERAVPESTDAKTIDEIFYSFRNYYIKNCLIKTKPYPDIKKLLCELKNKGYLIAMVSNKNHAAVSELNRQIFGDLIPVAIGEQEDKGIRKKPYPDSVLFALKQLNVSPDDAIYVGDSEVDIETAANSGLDCISVCWGFRDESLLKSLNPTAIIHHPLELLELLGN